MKHKDYLGLLPGQYTGKEVEAEASITCENEGEAHCFYELAKSRLLQVNDWHKVAGLVSAKFVLTDKAGHEKEGAVAQGDLLRIDIPGPGSKEGNGYDWVLVEELKEVSEADAASIGFRVRPAPNPMGRPDHIAHFYNRTATSSFIITREGATVTASIVDRNLMPNDNTESITDAIRHTVVGMGAIGAFSKAQWQNLAEGLVKK